MSSFDLPLGCWRGRRRRCPKSGPARKTGSASYPHASLPPSVSRMLMLMMMPCCGCMAAALTDGSTDRRTDRRTDQACSEFGSAGVRLDVVAATPHPECAEGRDIMQSSTARFKASSAASFTPSLFTSNPAIPKSPPPHSFVLANETRPPAHDRPGRSVREHPRPAAG